MNICKTWKPDNVCTLYHGDCTSLIAQLPNGIAKLVVSSPPYCMGKRYETHTKASEFLDIHKKLLPEIVRITADGGSICWQVGYHVKDYVTTPLDFLVYSIMREFKSIKLRNRIIWSFGHGLHSSSRFSGRHETILWFTKGDDYTFDLDAVRVPQKYPGKRHYKGDKKGQFSGHPKGKNPSDVWEVPNVKANHVEKTEHPCQYPIALAMRLIKALTKPDDLVCDPFMGSGATGAAAAMAGRRFLGAEIESTYYEIARNRIQMAYQKKLKYRREDTAVYEPPAHTPLTTVPPRWRKFRPDEDISLPAA
jgi:adenine-specific DNA-methyltransferase